MGIPNKYKFTIDNPFSIDNLSKGLYIAVLHATRVPPHIGLIVGGKYHSLSIKGQDINTSVAALIKNTNQRKIPTLFIKIKSHNTFSEPYLNEHFITNIQQFKRVDIDVATCLSPIKLFFEEIYNIQMNDIHFLFELIPKLYSEELIENTSSLFVDETKYELPVYNNSQINEGIEAVRNEFRKFTYKTL
jgi:hypothetical protein